MKLRKVYEIDGKITALTGLHIGMGNQEIHIGGIDNPVVRHPLSLEPYIPGSSIKGKMRTLLEYEQDGVSADGRPFCPANEPSNRNKPEKEKKELVWNHATSRIFGSSDTNYPSGPTRLVVRDCQLHPDFKRKMKDENLTVADLFEGKWETA
ncbi:MAG: type III-A CRISPR-associated RAMP protein Csm3, partial [Methanobacteriota archaeon]